MKDDGGYDFLPPRIMRTRYLSLPHVGAPVYGTSLNQSSSFNDTVTPRNVFDPSCFNPNPNPNDFMNSDLYFSQQLKSEPPVLPPDSWQLGMDEDFMSNSSCSNYASQGDPGNYSLWTENDTTDSLLIGSHACQNHASIGCGDYTQSASYPELPSTEDAHASISSAQFADGQPTRSRQNLPFCTGTDLRTGRLTSNGGSAVYLPSPENSTASSPEDEFNTMQFSPDPTTPSAANILSDVENDDERSDEPYAKLIYRALKTAPENKMVLKEIYEWFEKNTNKAKNSDSKGWQNSIRHNLSMNAAFEGMKDISSPDGGSRKTANVWVLTKDALEHGVQSTTRYRKPGAHKKSPKSKHPAPQRQRSGAKGGRAAKKAAKMRRVQQEPQKKATINKNVVLRNYQPRDDNIAVPNYDYRHQTFPDQTASLTPESLGLESVIATHSDSDLHENNPFPRSLFPPRNEVGLGFEDIR
ncbi:hypothetical protein AJ79_00862 [Helicocarpus griseus UAMH5409]|uniref:Fork-head domain-containing protein n=1 Tax=Helicocarpus griseus UAMH5409 TaxID=1447875 RepID=A0A2B7YA96_9EURO|nr:hypothetical protein AJ79_00862 [Helicocarpus griseus UAMH5409]